MSLRILKINWEALGVAASVACAIHCAILPIFLTSLPLFGVNIVHNLGLELLMLGAAFGIGFYSLRHGYKKHHHKPITLIIFSAGMAFFVLNQFLHFTLSPFILITPGILLILGAHFLNHRYCQKANHCHSTDCDH